MQCDVLPFHTQAAGCRGCCGVASHRPPAANGPALGPSLPWLRPLLPALAAPLLLQVQEVPCPNTTDSYRQYWVEAIAQDIKDTICRYCTARAGEGLGRECAAQGTAGVWGGLVMACSMVSP